MYERQSAMQLAPKVKATNVAQQNLSGSETYIGSIINTAPALQSLTYKLANTTTATKEFIIGDPTGLIAAAKGGTLVAPTSLNGNSSIVTANKAMLGYMPIKFGKIIFEATSSSAQFANAPAVHVCNLAGKLASDEINLQAAKTNVAQNSKILTVKCDLMLAPNRAITQVVDASETLLVTLCPVAYSEQ